MYPPTIMLVFCIASGVPESATAAIQANKRVRSPIASYFRDWDDSGGMVDTPQRPSHQRSQIPNPSGCPGPLWSGRSRLVSIFAGVIVLAAVSGSLLALTVRRRLPIPLVVFGSTSLGAVSVAERGVDRNDGACRAPCFGSHIRRGVYSAGPSS
jgi:hypothetical protein